MTLFATVGIGVLISLITQITKKTGLDGKLVLAVMAILAGVGYQAYTTFIDPEMQKQLTAFLVQAIGTANLFYSFVLKPLLQKNES